MCFVGSGAHFGEDWALGVSVGVPRGRSVAVLAASGFPGGLLGAFWCYLGCILGSSWAHLGLMLGSCWAHVGLILGSCWAMLGPVGEHLASTYAVKTANFKKVPKV